jgi:Protein of unknown function (DUF1579)
MEQPEPQKEHEWLQQLVGDWTFETEVDMGPNVPSMISTASDHSRALGDLWVLSEWEMELPDGVKGTSLMTLGYDPARQRFVGSFVTSSMTHHWLYEGELDESGKVLTLNAQGPNFAGEGMAMFQDIIEITGPNERRLYSQVQGPDGTWNRFMTSTFRRTA